MNDAKLGENLVHTCGLIFVRKGNLVKPLRRLGEKLLSVECIRLRRWSGSYRNIWVHRPSGLRKRLSISTQRPQVILILNSVYAVQVFQTFDLRTNDQPGLIGCAVYDDAVRNLRQIAPEVGSNHNEICLIDQTFL